MGRIVLARGGCDEGPIRFVNIPEGSSGPLFSRYNHFPALTACPNGDILAIGYLAATQAPDGVIHLISSALHYQFNILIIIDFTDAMGIK